MLDAEFLRRQAEQCRRLAASQTDPRLSGELLKMLPSAKLEPVRRLNGQARRGPRQLPPRGIAAGGEEGRHPIWNCAEVTWVLDGALPNFTFFVTRRGAEGWAWCIGRTVWTRAAIFMASQGL
jgi:hypothetical protein